MGFAIGKLKRLIHGKKGSFDVHDIAGDWLEDVNGKRGWVLQVIGLDPGSFCVIDGKIHRCGIHTPGTLEDSTDIITDPSEAVISKSTEKAIADAIAKWEKEEGEKV